MLKALDECLEGRAVPKMISDYMRARDEEQLRAIKTAYTTKGGELAEGLCSKMLQQKRKLEER